MARPKKQTKTYHDAYNTSDQQVSKDGATIRMANGHVFKRTVLPSVAVKKTDTDTEQVENLLDELED